MNGTTVIPEKAAAKIARLTSLAEEGGLDAVAISSQQNVAYFGGTYLITQALVPDRLAFLVVRHRGEATLLVCDIEESLVRAQSPLPDVRVYVEFAKDPTVALAEFLRELGLSAGRVGIDARRLNAESVWTLQRLLPEIELVAVDDELEATQMSKDADEVEALEAAARATQAAVEDGISGLPAVATERALVARVMSTLLDAGGLPLFSVFGSGERGMLAHAEAADRPTQPGEIFRIDVGARWPSGHLSDLARTGVVGEPAPEQEEVLIGVAAAQAAVFEAVEPGRPVEELFDVCKGAFERYGLPFWMPHIGHGLGIGLHESPRIHPGNATPLAPGMVLNIEPFCVLPERREAYHVEDLVLVAEDGHRLLSSPQQRLLRAAA